MTRFSFREGIIPYENSLSLQLARSKEGVPRATRTSTYVGDIRHAAGDQGLRLMPPLRLEAGGHAEEQLGRRPDLELLRRRDRPVVRAGPLRWLGCRSVFAMPQCTRDR